jgi:hypothetical protein
MAVAPSDSPAVLAEDARAIFAVARDFGVICGVAVRCEVKGKLDNLSGLATVIRHVPEITRFRRNVLLLLSVPIPVDGLAEE